ncbi:MAG TPA: hypothetical protein VES19_10995, partial [Candidatus Limnocylindrales bacterium]|nr:hypothetical protein [Candidatus Limnocylindrales bacterium]
RERVEALAAAARDLDVEAAAAPEDVGTRAQVVISCAPIVRHPARPVHRAHLPVASVVCAVDFDATFAQDVVEDAVMFVVDDVAQYEHYRHQGYFDGYPAEASELCDVLDPVAAHPPGLKAYVPLGIALEDVAVAAEINRRAVDAGLGRELPL